MRVLEVFGEPISHGGQEAFVFSVLEKINIEDLQIDFFTPYYSDNNRYEDMIVERGGKLYQARLPFLPGASRKNIVYPLNQVLNNKYDVVHVHSGSISVLAYVAEAAKKAGVNKVIVHSHADGLKKNFKYRLSKCINGIKLDKYPDVYCACSVRAGEWKFSKSVVKNDLIIINNGIDVDRFHYNLQIRSVIRKQIGVKDGDLLIGQVGRFSVGKNHLFSLGLLKELMKESDKYKMIFVGDGELRDEIEDYIKNNGLSNNIVLTGNVTNTQDYYNAMDVLVFPSLYEGFGIVAIEAQSTGLSVIASDSIPQDINVSDKVMFNSLSDMQKWIDDIKNVNIEERADRTALIKAKKYDSVSVAEEVRELYFS